MKKFIVGWVILLFAVVLAITLWFNYWRIEKTNEEITWRSSRLEELQKNLENMGQSLENKISLLSSPVHSIIDSAKKGERKKNAIKKLPAVKTADTVMIIDYRRDSLLLLQDSIQSLFGLMTKENEKLVIEGKKIAENRLNHYIDSLHLARIGALKNENYLFKAVNKNNINLVLLQSTMIDNYHYLIYAIENESKAAFIPEVKFGLSAIKSSGTVESIPPDKKSVCWAIFEGKNSNVTIENLPLMLQIK